MSNRWKSSLGFILLFLFPVYCGAEDAATPPRVYQEVGALVEDLETIRGVLGIRAPRERSFRLSEAEPRQVFFQAQTLFRKCNSLAQEIAGLSRQVAAQAPDREIRPADVLEVVQASRQQLDYVRDALNIDTRADLPRLNRRSTPSDVMHDIIEAGYIINEMVHEQPDWASIYDRVKLMITYVGGLHPEATRYPELPAFECCKQPEDVYQSLLAAMEAARPLAESVDLPIVRIAPRKRAEGGASPSTVYDLTTTMVSDLAELTLRLEAEDTERPNYERPSRILPSHVYQLASVLQQMITAEGSNVGR